MKVAAVDAEAVVGAEQVEFVVTDAGGVAAHELADQIVVPDVALEVELVLELEFEAAAKFVVEDLAVDAAKELH